MTKAEKFYSKLSEEDKWNVFDLMRILCPFTVTDSKTERDREMNKLECDAKTCFECWMSEVEE